MQYLGIDWSYRRAAWCALSEGGGLVREGGAVPADEDGLARLVLELGPDVRAVVEMMSGAVSSASIGSAAGARSACMMCSRRSSLAAAPGRWQLGACVGQHPGQTEGHKRCGRRVALAPAA
jgi:hypothetical protein